MVLPAHAVKGPHVRKHVVHGSRTTVVTAPPEVEDLSGTARETGHKHLFDRAEGCLLRLIAGSHSSDQVLGVLIQHGATTCCSGSSGRGSARRGSSNRQAVASTTKSLAVAFGLLFHLPSAVSS